MIAAHSFAGQTVAVLGLGKSGLSAARALAAGGAKVRAWDDDPKRREAAAAKGLVLEDPYAMEWRGIAALVLSPGIPLHWPEPHQVVTQARCGGATVIGDIELFAREKLPAPVVAITGTNGKSTTTALTAFVLRQAGRKAVEGGNLGTPVLDLPNPGADGAYALELSSYQIDLTQSLAADVAVLLNLSPDHIDRHGSLAGYIAAKERLFQMQRRDQLAVIGVDDADSRALFERLAAIPGRRVLAVSATHPVKHGVYVQDGVLFDATGGAAKSVVDLKAGKLKGVHNWQNAAAAFAAATALGCVPAVAAQALLVFPGLAHRIEDVGEVDGVRFYNDSKATNADAAARALACFDEVYWIAGGRPKEGGIASLAEYFPRIRHAFLIGEAAPAFAATLHGKVQVTHSGTLGRAVADAFHLARAEHRGKPVVLLSPACASFDQFTNFEARGDQFRALASSLTAAGGGSAGHAGRAA